MTIEERERKIKESMPAAVAALTAVLNDWAEVTQYYAPDGTIESNVDKNLEVLASNAMSMDNMVTMMTQLQGIHPGEIGSNYLYLARKVLEQTMERPMKETPPWEQ